MKSSNSKLVKIAKIKEAKGLRGEVKVLFLSGDSSLAENLTAVFINDREYEIQSTSPTSETRLLNIKFVGVDDRDQAEKLKGAEIYIPSQSFESKTGEDIFLREILHFEVLDGESVVGCVVGFDSNNAQDLIVVEDAQKKQHLVPLVKDFILKIDFENKKIKMNLPPGLFHAL